MRVPLVPPAACHAGAESATTAPVEAAWAAVLAAGGTAGWGRLTWLWCVRGALDRILGGPGMRGRRLAADALAPGDVIDWWRVGAIEAPRRLHLIAEMRVPGAATLDLDVLPAVGGRATIRATARFQPRGLGGRVYWYALLPAHLVVFGDLTRGIAARAERMASSASGVSEAGPGAG